MSFYLKKALRFGPLRFNLSKSGIGVSAGVKGFRIGTGPRGNYIHAGRGGIYYRKTFSGWAAGRSNVEIAPVNGTSATSIPKETRQFLIDASSKELVTDLNEKRNKLRTLPACLIVSIAGMTLAIYNNLPAPVIAILAVCSVWLCTASAIWDRRRKVAVLFYDIEAQVLAAFEALHSVLEEVQRCPRVCHSDSTELYSDRKYHAGVLQGIERSNAHPIAKPPPLVKTNIALFAIPAGKLTLYFCPDRVLVYGLTDIAAVAYSDLRLTIETCRFVESERVFPDQQIVGNTWQYVNKDGGPDRRFHNNRQLPIVLYEELHVKAPSGLNEVFQFSKAGTAAKLADAIKDLGRVLVLTKFWASLDHNNCEPTVEEGIWCRYPHAQDLTFRIASTRTKPLADKVSEIRSLCEGPTSKRGCELIINALVGTVLLDWGGLTDRGTSVAFNADNARAVLTQSVELLSFITGQAMQLAKPRSDGRGLGSDSTAITPPLHVEGPELHNFRPDATDDEEELLRKCLEIIRQEKRASTSLLQRRLRLGYTRAARIVDILEQRGILGPGEGAKPREILVDLDAAV